MSLVSTAALPLDSSGHAAPKTKTFEGKDFEDKNLRFVAFSIYVIVFKVYTFKSLQRLRRPNGHAVRGRQRLKPLVRN